MEIVNIKWETKVSKNGKNYSGLFAVLDNGTEVLLTFDKSVYYQICQSLGRFF